jgi:hypothetical protein
VGIQGYSVALETAVSEVNYFAERRMITGSMKEESKGEKQNLGK